MQATSRSHPKSWKCNCSLHWTRWGSTQKLGETYTWRRSCVWLFKWLDCLCNVSY
jgi:hypothetical protein